MLSNSRWFHQFVVLFGLGMVGLSGCNYLPGNQPVAEDNEFGDLEQSLLNEPLKTAASAEEESLELKLKVGDRFPLKKTVEQILTQATPEGTTHTKKLETLLSVTVEELRGADRRLGVRYHRVRFTQDIAGHKVAYASDNGGAVPPEAAQYAGLVDNGFSFWLSGNNEILELIGFDQFMNRCTQYLPPEQRPKKTDGLASVRSEDGLANFIDDSIGLMPAGRDAAGKPFAVQVGYSWEPKPRRVDGELPMQIKTRCVLKEFNSKVAEIDMIGQIAAASVNNERAGVRLDLLHGHCHGNCLVDRITGLPTRSRVERFLEMSVQLADGTKIPQRKQIITSIETYPEQLASNPRQIELTSGILDVSLRKARPQ